MGHVKTFFLAALTGGLTLAPMCLAQSSPADDQLRFFATCAGRLSAQMEHQWLFDGQASEQTQRQRAGVIELLEAIIPAGRGHEVLAWRIEAKQAQAVLLTRSTFVTDPRQARLARKLAVRRLGECRTLLLG
ncbi:hypothetical protein [Thalassovita sp.]|uniref:hypothetical protein n=1 Tax=Thalassovita sp. TaxID=1979401 RepID=UPI0029DE8798|nr:hypothetical protein [Thalassovita sp.]